MARGVVCLLNGQETTLNRIGGGQAAEGTEIAPDLVINRIQLVNGGATHSRGSPISFEVWVEPEASV